MAFSQKRKEELEKIAATLWNDDETRARLERFMAESGLREQDIAEEIGYSRVAVNHFRHGRYSQGHWSPEQTIGLRAAVKEYIESHPTDHIRRTMGKVYHTETYKEIRKAFFKALDNGFAYCVDGAPGTQKTFMLHALIAELQRADASKNGHGRRAIYVRCRPGIRPKDLLMRIAMAAGISTRGNIDELLRKVRFHFGNRRVLLILDEGQHLDHHAIETVRELLDEPPYFGLLFAGSHDLQQKFNDLHMEQWRSRLQKVVQLEGLTEQEAADIIVQELGASPQAKIASLIAKARTPDFRRDKGYTYISARNLFFAIQQIKLHKAQLPEGATA